MTKRAATSPRRGGRLEQFSQLATRAAGSPFAFVAAAGVILAWLISGPVFGFSDTWQLIINTGTTIVTFLMVFLIQRAQNKDALAIQIKLNELIAATRGASNRLVDVESLSELELQTIHRHFTELAALVERETDLRQSHSIDEAAARHQEKEDSRRAAPSA